MSHARYRMQMQIVKSNLIWSMTGLDQILEWWSALSRHSVNQKSSFHSFFSGVHFHFDKNNARAWIMPPHSSDSEHFDLWRKENSRKMRIMLLVCSETRETQINSDYSWYIVNIQDFALKTNSHRTVCTVSRTKSVWSVNLHIVAFKARNDSRYFLSFITFWY